MSAYYCGGDANKGSRAAQAVELLIGIVQDETCTLVPIVLYRHIYGVDTEFLFAE
jgi:hypothetical protein